MTDSRHKQYLTPLIKTLTDLDKYKHIREMVRLINSNQQLNDSIAVAQAIRIFNTKPMSTNKLSPIEIHNSFHPNSLAFLSNSGKHPFNATRRELNMKVKMIKEKERLKREKQWIANNKNRKVFKGEIGDLCLVRTKFQNKSRNLFSEEIW